MERKKQIIESALLSGKSIDELIKIKMKEEIKNTFEKVNKAPQKIRIYDIKEIPSKILFSKNTVFKKFNKENNTMSYINGLQAEGMLGLDDTSRKRLLSGETEVFSTENSFIKFEYSEILKN